jgi:hypothetical protein
MHTLGRTGEDYTTGTGQVLNPATFTIAMFPNEVKGFAMLFWINMGGKPKTRYAIFFKFTLSI